MKKLVLLATLCACASVPLARRSVDERAKNLKAPGDAANVYIYRPGGITGIAIKFRLLFDESWVGDLAPSTFVVLTVRPGEHKLVVGTPTGSVDKPLVVEPGRNYYVRTSPALVLAGPGASVDLVTDETSAREDLRGCGLIASAAAETIRHVAEAIAKLSVDPVESDVLVARAAKALEVLGGRREATQASDLDETVAWLRSMQPGLSDQQIAAQGAMAMAASLRPQRAEDVARAVDGTCGLLLRREGHETVIAGVVPDSPAAVARLEAGVQLREVDGRSTRDYPLGAIVQSLAGTPGSEVALTLGKPGEAEDRKVVLRRAPAETGAVDCRVIHGEVLYLRPWDTSPATARRLRDHGRTVGAAARLVILDLRDDLGGPVEGAKDLADSFLAAGVILSVVGARAPDLNRSYSAQPGASALESARVVVLVNGNTSGAAEAVAAAVQDNHRGAVLGSRTAGLAQVVTLHRLGGIRLGIPTARLVRANGQPLEGHGVTPDALAAPPAPRSAMNDAACPNVASPASVSDDPLVRRAVGLLLATSAD